MRVIFSILLYACFITPKVMHAQTTTVDVCVYGGSSAGVIAAYTAINSGKTAILIEPGNRVGGLSAGGLGYTDIGNKYAVSGLALDFYRRLGKQYNRFESWIFEPKKALEVFQQYIDEANITVMYERALYGVQKEGNTIRSITINDPVKPSTSKQRVIRAAMFIDCTYEGDLMAKAGVSYTIGREDNSLYQETYNGVQLLDKHQFPDGIDPYIIPGKPESGLVWGVSKASLKPRGTGDSLVQAYNFRICLSDDSANRIPITKPAGYNADKYALLLRYLEKKVPGDLWGFLKFDLMPNHKTDINNNGPFSTDMIGMNYNYAEADYATRRKIIREHELYTKGLLYFIGNDPRMPEHLRKQMLRWGYPKDEYTKNGNWSPQLYVREARRMMGEYVMTQANCEGRTIVEDGVGIAAYTMDSHNCQRLVVNGMVKNEGDVQIGGSGPYPIAYRSIVPKAGECSNLLVPVCLSASHIAYGSIRMEPVFMVLGQSAALAAVMAIDNNKTIQQIDVQALRSQLKKDPLVNGTTPELVIDNEDTAQVQIRGNWTLQKGKGYGPSFLTASGSEEQTVTYKPISIKPGSYNVYAYLLTNYDKSAPSIRYTIFDGIMQHQKTIHKKELTVQGQTSGEWVYLGAWEMKPGASVTIHAQGEGIFLADAILFSSSNL